MLADSSGIMPDGLKIEADKRFFENGLDHVDVVVHGRHSHEGQAGSPARRRLIVTRQVSNLAPDPENANALLWNPSGATLEDAMAQLGLPNGIVGVVGGTLVFDLFLDRYNVFYLSRVPHLHLPGGRPVFGQVPQRAPEDILADHGLIAAERFDLDPAKGVTLTAWRRPAN